MNSDRLLNRRVVFLDRDGVLNVDKYVTYRPTQFELIEDVAEGLSCLQELGFSFIVISNQAAIGRGHITLDQFEEFNRILVDQLQAHGIQIADIFFCPHDPVHGKGEYKQECACRKPKPGMFFQAADKYHLQLSECYYIGDKKADVVAGYNAGCSTILVETGILDDEGMYPGVSPDFRVRNLVKAAQVIAGELAIRRICETRTFMSPFSQQNCALLLRS